jgi:hypothetical protein
MEEAQSSTLVEDSEHNPSKCDHDFFSKSTNALFQENAILRANSIGTLLYTVIWYIHTPRTPIYDPSLTSQLRSLTASQPHGLPVLLKLGDKLIALPDHIIILLVLVIRSVRLDNTFPGHTVNSAGNALGCNKLG